MGSAKWRIPNVRCLRGSTHGSAPTCVQLTVLIAEEVAKVDPALVLPDKEGKPYTVRYDQVNAMLLNEFLKAHRKIEEQQKQIEALTAAVQKVSASLN